MTINGAGKESSRKTTVKAAAVQLREIALAADEGALLGSEDALVDRLGCARATARQAARLIEREGLLRVRRGLNGGYFAARPDARHIESTMSAYLETLDLDAEDVTILASALWVEAIRKAATTSNRAAAQKLAEDFKKRVRAIKPNAPFYDIVKLERECRTAVFKLTDSRYIELIFAINSAFAHRHFSQIYSRTDERDEQDPAHPEFVSDWRDSKIMELSAIAYGDVTLADAAGRYGRTVWQKKVNQRLKETTPDAQEQPPRAG